MAFWYSSIRWFPHTIASNFFEGNWPPAQDFWDPKDMKWTPPSFLEVRTDGLMASLSSHMYNRIQWSKGAHIIAPTSMHLLKQCSFATSKDVWSNPSSVGIPTALVWLFITNIDAILSKDYSNRWYRYPDYQLNELQKRNISTASLIRSLASFNSSSNATIFTFKGTFAILASTRDCCYGYSKASNWKASK